MISQRIFCALEGKNKPTELMIQHEFAQCHCFKAETPTMVLLLCFPCCLILCLDLLNLFIQGYCVNFLRLSPLDSLCFPFLIRFFCEKNDS